MAPASVSPRITPELIHLQLSGAVGRPVRKASKSVGAALRHTPAQSKIPWYCCKEHLKCVLNMALIHLTRSKRLSMYCFASDPIPSVTLDVPP